MAIDLALIGVAVALLSPVYGLLFQIQRRLGAFEVRIEGLDRRVADNTEDLE